jgi:hypothetical protein
MARFFLFGVSKQQYYSAVAAQVSNAANASSIPSGF